ncbi:GroEL apical domain-like protein [Coprinopsis marcescibilis]|uniref:T-complex protein 1 subunit gamma n=1 Tax=Coprinopsis marcescibilis TaxID=230819 RepID=A0A5C3KT88_COPMA|nr:GroEL apical domain-like protein [Coprinopsis marcescibilis]
MPVDLIALDNSGRKSSRNKTPRRLYTALDSNAFVRLRTPCAIAPERWIVLGIGRLEGMRHPSPIGRGVVLELIVLVHRSCHPQGRHDQQGHHPPQHVGLIKNPRIILLDCPLEYKKGESQTNMEFSKADDWARAQEIEEEQVKAQCYKLLELKPDLIIAENGVSDLAQHVFERANVSCIRRLCKTDNNRVALAVGATIFNRIEDIREADVGTECGLFKVQKIGDEYFTSLVECTSPKACAVLPRGPSKDILNEIARNLADAMSVAPGGGATEVAISVGLQAKAKSIAGADNAPFRAVADGFDIIPVRSCRTVGGNAMRVLTELKAKHVAGENTWSLDGNSGKNVDMKEYGLWESASVKVRFCVYLFYSVFLFYLLVPLSFPRLTSIAVH